MPPLVFADNFLAGSIISLLIPLCLLIAIVAWYHLLATRQPEAAESSPSLPPSEVVEAAGPAVAEVTPVEPHPDRAPAAQPGGAHTPGAPGGPQSPGAPAGAQTPAAPAEPPPDRP